MRYSDTGETFSVGELGMEHIKLDHAEALEKFPEKVEAKCVCCGASFDYYRGQGLSCPYCAAGFEEVYFSRGKTIAFFEGEKTS